MTWQTEFLVNLDYYTEGPCVDANGAIYFTSLVGGNIYKITRPGHCEIWANSFCPNGQLILPNGDHMVCDSQLSTLVCFSKDGSFIQYGSPDCADLGKIRTPNDLIADLNGNLYITDSVRKDGAVFLQTSSGQSRCLLTGLDYPNGLAFSPDESILYLAESYKNRILCFDKEGLLNGNREAIQTITLPQHSSAREEMNLPDGLAVNQHGVLAIAHYGMQAIQLYDAEGNWLGYLETPFPLVSNLCFLSSDTLIVTGGYAEPGPGAVILIRFLMN